MKSHRLLIVLAACLCATAVSSSAADRPRPGSDVPGPGNAAGIHNRVLDLLDTDVVLEVGDPAASWESEPFATARFNRIGLRIGVGEESLPVRCRVCWRFDDDDACLDGVPLVYAPYAPFAPLAPLPGVDPVRPTPPVAVLEAVDFTEVRGLSARVRCRIPDPVFIGDDSTAPDETTATLTDVKVLLRRE